MTGAGGVTRAAGGTTAADVTRGAGGTGGAGVTTAAGVTRGAGVTTATDATTTADVKTATAQVAAAPDPTGAPSTRRGRGPAPEPAPAPKATTVTTLPRPQPGAKKAAPTPTRKQALAARQERLNPVLTKKEQRRRDRMAQEQRRVEGIQKANEKPPMMLVRDYVDCRWTIATFVLPAVLVIIVLPLALGALLPQVVNVSFIVVLALYLGMIADMAVIWFGLRRTLRRYFPNEPLRGKLSYAFSRAMLIRRWRKPPPVVKRGSAFVWPREVTS